MCLQTLTTMSKDEALARKIIEPFNRYYDEMYDGKREDCPEEYIDKGDAILHTQKPFLAELYLLFGLFITSDREACALALACEELARNGIDLGFDIEKL